MEDRKNIQHYKIFDYWKDKAITENGEIVNVDDEKYFNSSIEIVYDWGEPECFACRHIVESVVKDERYEQWLDEEDGLKKIWNHKSVRKKLEKAHIIPHSLGGNEEPQNMFLLCKKCHQQAPDTNNPRNFFRYVYMKRKSPNRNQKRYMMFMEECINRNLNFTTQNIEQMLENVSSHGAEFSDYTWAMGLADTCEEFRDSMEDNVLKEIQKKILNDYLKNFLYNI